MPLPVIIIFDIGKTNKKILLFDNQYRLVYEECRQLEETVDEDGFPCEDIALLSSWVLQSFAKLFSDSFYKIEAVNVCTYGASFVHLNENYQSILPLYNYLKPLPDALFKRFKESYCKGDNLWKETASPSLHNLNSGLQLYWLKYAKPEVFGAIRYSLHLPQYISFLLGGKLGTDITSIGCHTALWNFSKKAYHNWVFSEEINHKLPPIVPCTEASCLNDKNIAIGCGLHDSSAALIPYLASFEEPFVLLSTGTWSISLNPFDNTPLTADDLENDCLCYLSYLGEPVKASRLFAGNEHEQQTKRLASHFNTKQDYYKTVHYNPELVSNASAEIQATADKTKKLLITESPFGTRDLNAFISYEEAYHQLMIDIIAQQKEALQRVMKEHSTKILFVDGGFSKNDVFMNLLADAYSSLEVYSATVAQASALGAAIAIKDAWNSLPLPKDLIDIKRYKSASQVVL